MSATLQLASDAHLFILDDEGVVFVEGNENLYALNTTATFVWCLLEEGRSETEIVEALAQTFPLDRDQARRFTTDIIAEWCTLGLLTGGSDAEATQIDFLTALGRLVTDATLRERFVADPRATADELQIRAEEFDAVASLDPVGLEAQADVLLAKRLHKRSRSLPKASESSCAVAASAKSAPAATFIAERSLRLLSVNLRLRFSSVAQEQTVRPLLAHLETAPTASPDVVLDIVEDAHEHVIIEAGAQLGRCMTLNRLTPVMKLYLVCLAASRYDYFLDVHAGVVGDEERCVLLPGTSGAGKSSLTAALVHAGFRYYSDEIALLQEPDFRVHSLPLSLSIKQSGWDVIGRYFPDLRNQPMHYRADGIVVRYITPSRETLPAAENEACPVGWIVFPRHQPHAETTLRPLRGPEALRRLIGECLAIPNRLTTEQVARLVKWIQNVPCFELVHSSLPRAVELIQNLTRRSNDAIH